MKGEISEIILTIGLLIAVSITLLLLKPIIFKQSEISQDQIISEFSNDIETTINRVIAATNDVSLTYRPFAKKYVFVASNNFITIQDKATEKYVSFSKEGNQISDTCFEDAQKITVKKTEQKIDIIPEEYTPCASFKTTTTVMPVTTTTTIGEVCKNEMTSCPSNIKNDWIAGFNEYYDEIKEAVIQEKLEEYLGSVDNSIYLVAALITQESNWNQETTCTTSGGCGLMQIVKGTADSSCPDLGGFDGVKNDATKNIKCGVRVLKNKIISMISYNQHGYQNLIKLSLAAYNGGQGTIGCAIDNAGSSLWSNVATLENMGDAVRDCCGSACYADPNRFKTLCANQGINDPYDCKANIIIHYVDIVSSLHSPWSKCKIENTCKESKGTCPVQSPTITCGSYGSNYPRCIGGHGSNTYWSGSASEAGKCSYNIGGFAGPSNPTDPDGNTNVCYNRNWKLGDTYGYAVDVASMGSGAPVVLPSINGKIITWSWTGAELGSPNDDNPIWGYIRVYRGTDEDNNKYEIWLSHMNRDEGNVKNVPPGTRVGSLFNLGTGTHLHVELLINGKYVKPEFLCS